MKKQKGFTLIELIIVVSILIVLLAALFVLLDPGRRLAEARNSDRSSDVRNLGDAIKTYQVDTGGSLPAGIDTSLRMLGTDGSGCNVTCSTFGATENACLNISSDIAGSYIASIPEDPSGGTSAQTQYAVRTYGSRGVEIVSCTPELGEQISFIR